MRIISLPNSSVWDQGDGASAVAAARRPARTAGCRPVPRSVGSRIRLAPPSDRTRPTDSVRDWWYQGAVPPGPPGPAWNLARCRTCGGTDRSRQNPCGIETVVALPWGYWGRGEREREGSRSQDQPSSHPRRATYVPHGTVNGGEPRGIAGRRTVSTQVGKLRGQP
jgi:hypothetical protein